MLKYSGILLKLVGDQEPFIKFPLGVNPSFAILVNLLKYEYAYKSGMYLTCSTRLVNIGLMLNVLPNKCDLYLSELN